MVRLLLRMVIAPIIVLSVILTSVVAAQEPDTGQQTHIVASGENLYRIAVRYGVTVDALAEANGIGDTRRIYTGQVLVIPDGSRPAAPPDAPVPEAPDPEAPDVSSQTLPPSTGSGQVVHVVRRGESLSIIAQQYGVTWTAIAHLNGIENPDQIEYGQALLIPDGTDDFEAQLADAPAEQPSAPQPEPAPVVNQAPAPAAGETTHVVARGESLASIGRQYGVPWPAIAQVNGITNPNQLFAGQVLTIPDPANLPEIVTTPAPPPAAAPAPVNPGADRYILVELNKQTITAFENGQPVRSTLVSTGLPATPTVTGDYYIYVKLTSQTMSGPGYYLPDVPWVMYFYQGYGIHGTYWHNNFGQPMSHGCVNLPTPEAEWFFQFATVGTMVRVVY